MTIRVEHGNMLEVLGRMVAEGASVQSVVTDAPYHLQSIVKRFGAENAKPVKAGVYARGTTGFMGKAWDGGDIAFQSGTWRLCWELLPPGGHLVAFAGTRTYHRMAVAIEEAGFEIRDTIGWLYGSGFPKSHNVGNKLPEWEGWGTALKPAMELICLARKPLDGTVAQTVLVHGTGALNIDGCRVGTESTRRPLGKPLNGGAYGSDRNDRETLDKIGGSDAGRWPANVVHDGSDEVVSAFPDQTSGGTPPSRPRDKTRHTYGAFGGQENPDGIGSTSGNAARFFYSAKADADDRLGSKHPTVKPVDLMRWLVRLITPPGGTVLDPFAGSGTTGMACMAEGFDALLIEREAEYVADIRRRLAHVHGHDTPLFMTGESS